MSMSRINEELKNALSGGVDLDDEMEEDVVEEKKDVTSVPMEEDEVEDNLQYEELNYDLMERAKYIPLRLSYEERKYLRLVNAAINVSDYTNAVDMPFKNISKRKHVMLQQICGFLSCCIASGDYEKGQEVLEDRNFSEHEADLKCLVEIARRYKIMNPEKMRSEYGKLVYLLQDATSATIKPLLDIDLNIPIKTVYSLLEAKHGLELLKHPNIKQATQEVLADKGKSRHEIQKAIKGKEQAIKLIVRHHESHRLTADQIRLCLYSMADHNSFLNSCRLPIDESIELLTKYFHPHNVSQDYSLSITEGLSGARLTHSHESQYNYVLQSLTLWSSIVEDMFRLWYLAECDLMDENQPYELRNTGQGLQRVQQSPRVYKAMHEILHHNQKILGNWVGSSVIHLGDHNVPNALVFIDKYTQVSRILGPLVKTLSNLEDACAENEGLGRYMKSYGGLEKARQDILYDFFTHAFDGSGGDNFFDAGSCIDGRLTSAWNWCSQLSTKPYYTLFRLTGFLSFDGEFDK